MADTVVEMDYNMIRAVAAGFVAQAEQLAGVIGVLASAIATCFALAFVSFGTSTAIVGQLMSIIEKATKAAAKCVEISQDLLQAVGDHQKGDVQGKQYFMKGRTV